MGKDLSHHHRLKFQFHFSDKVPHTKLFLSMDPTHANTYRALSLGGFVVKTVQKSQEIPGSQVILSRAAPFQVTASPL